MLEWFYRKLWGSTCLYLPSAGITTVCHYAQHFTDVQRIKLRYSSLYSWHLIDWVIFLATHFVLEMFWWIIMSNRYNKRASNKCSFEHFYNIIFRHIWYCIFSLSITFSYMCRGISFSSLIKDFDHSLDIVWHSCDCLRIMEDVI